MNALKTTSTKKKRVEVRFQGATSPDNIIAISAHSTALSNIWISSYKAMNIVMTTDKKGLTIHDLGWTRDEALELRGRLAAFAEDWDDPSMDIYDEVY